jgi:hypothetical protein
MLSQRAIAAVWGEKTMQSDADTIREYIDLRLPLLGGIVERLERAPESTIPRVAYDGLVPELQAICSTLIERGAAGVDQGDYIDPDDKRIKKLKRAYEAIGVSQPNIDPLAGLAKACRALRAAIISHDLAAEPSPVSLFDSSAARIAALHEGTG